jgi:hypothetical protein
MVWCSGVVVDLLGTVPPQGFKALVRRMLFLDPDPHAYITQVASLALPDAYAVLMRQISCTALNLAYPTKPRKREPRYIIR